ncbi:MAG TPA: NAD(P)H-quinone oxidoreductase [Rhizomicrobium sp.]|jgi:putative PIG3 family NAD(P)H quinone oxidoreductase|nr:NAD(P)H-quinone oxidoreductase [Rhizomicrobium sp.]
MKATILKDPGTTYRLTLGEAPMPKPGPREILIKVAAAGVNRADLHQAHGGYPPPPGAPDTLGMEVSGHVTAVGNDAAPYKVGDAVMALLGGGGYAEYALARIECVLPLPSTLDVIEAASLPEALFTAWTNIVDTGRLTPGETLLVHGGTSGIGVIAIQMFAQFGHTVFATAGSDEKCRLCEDLGARRGINYRDQDFVAVTKEATAGRGVDVILDMVGGDYVQRNISAAAVWGRIVNIAYQNGARVALDLSPLLRKRLTLAATTLRARTVAEKGAIREALAAQVLPLVAAGQIRPVVDQRFPLAEAQKAHEYMEKTGATGKILLIP